MNVLQVNTVDSQGGAGKAAFRLHQSLPEQGVFSRMLVRTKVSKRKEVFALADISPAYIRLADRIGISLNELLGWQFSFFPGTHRLPDHNLLQNIDVINLHNTHGNYFSHTVLPQLTQQYPVVWTLHDMWAFTGHCAYSGDCSRWKIGCGKCPYLDVYPKVKRDFTAAMWRQKERIYKRSKLKIVTPSTWLADLARSSPLLGQFEVVCIPNSVDTAVYHPIPQEAARQTLGISSEKRILMFAAHNPQDKRKGLDILIQALHQISPSKHKLQILLVGETHSDLATQLPFPVVEVGQVQNDRLMAACYAAADIFVLPTRQDNLPNSLLESIACGTPIVSFNVGGVPEVITHMETGFLAEPETATHLKEGIETLLVDSSLLRKMSNYCREIALEKFALSVQAQRYKSLYKKWQDEWSEHG